MLVQTWREAYLLWDAKDWSMEALALEIKEQIASGKRPTLANLTVNGRRLSLSESSIQRLASTGERIPDVLAELARVANGPHVPKLNAVKLARIVARRIAKKLPSLTFARLAFVAGLAALVGCGSWFLLDKARKPPPQMALSVYVSAGSAPVIFSAQSLLGASDLGEKPLDQQVPDKPLPGQKVPPCEARLYEVAIGGGCWFESGAAKPPCGMLFRNGDKCYRPIAADPQKPVGADASPAPARR